MAGNPIANLLGKVNASNALVVTLDGGTASATTFLAGDGAVGTPSYSFTSDPDTGLYTATGNTIAIANGGTQGYRLGLSTLWMLSQTAAIDMGSGGDVSFGRGAANRLDLATGDSFYVINGGIGAGIAPTATAFVTAGAGTLTVAPLVITNGTNLTTATANAIENDGAAFYKTQDTTNGRTYWDGWNYFSLTGSGSGITSIADFFGATSAIPLVANGFYEIEWFCYFSQATAGIATWTIVTATTALATLTGEYEGSNIAGIGTVGANQTAAINTTASSSTAFPVTGTEATGTTHYFKIRAKLQAGNGASNTRLRLTMSAGTATPLINSYFRVRRLSGANVGAFVA